MSPPPTAAAGDPSDDLMGRVLKDRYRITGRLARGGMGSVFLGVDEGTGGEVAIKVVRGELAQSEEALARFEREVRAVIHLDSPHIVTAHDAGTVDGMPYLVMERLRGRGLDELQQAEPLDARRSCTIVLDLLEGLADAHAAGVIHRDLKPSNVWLTDDDRVKILDFGVAKMHGAASMTGEEAGKLTGSGAVLGSPAYMSPEQLVSSKEADERADLWSVGVVLYELLTGTMLFKAETVGGIFANVIRMRIPPLRERIPGASADLERVVARCLARDPQQRFSSASVLAEKLRALLEADARGEAPLVQDGVSAPIVSPLFGADDDDAVLAESPTIALPSTPAGSGGASRRSNRWLGGVIIAATLVIAAIAFVGARSSSAPAAADPSPPVSTATATDGDEERKDDAAEIDRGPARAAASGAPSSASADLPEPPSAPTTRAIAPPAAPPVRPPPPSTSASTAPPEDDLWETSRQ